MIHITMQSLHIMLDEESMRLPFVEALAQACVLEYDFDVHGYIADTDAEVASVTLGFQPRCPKKLEPEPQESTMVEFPPPPPPPTLPEPQGHETPPPPRTDLDDDIPF